MNQRYQKSHQTLEPLLLSVELLENSRDIVESTFTELGRLMLETVLSMSAAQIAGEPQRGKRKGEVRHHGSQPGSVRLAGKRVQVRRPRLRARDGHEVPVPAYETLRRDPRQADRALSRVLAGVSTREYNGIFDEAGEELGVSRSNVSRQVRQASEKALNKLLSRKIDKRQLAVLIDGVHVGEHVLLVALGMDENGDKRVLGIQEGATENSAAAGSLLDSLISKGLDPEFGILFVLDGSKALRKAVKDRFANAEIQRCRVHKVRNVLEHLPLAKRNYVKAKLNLAYRLPYKEALAKLEEIAGELETMHPGAANSLKEGMDESLTLSRLGISGLLAASLSSTNFIESSFSRTRHRMRRITNVSSGEMALKWAASALLLGEKNYRAVKGFKDIWMLQTALDHPRQTAMK